MEWKPIERWAGSFRGAIGLRVGARAACVLLAAAAAPPACVPQGSELDEPAAASVAQALSSSPPVALTPPTARRVEVRAAGAGFEIEVQSPEGFSPRAFDPVLMVGQTVFRSYRESPTVGEYGAVYAVSPEQFATLSDGAAISIAWGPSAARAQEYGRLNKAAVGQ